MATSALRLSKSEWRQVSDIAAQLDWARHSASRQPALETGLSDRAAAALNQLLRLM